MSFFAVRADFGCLFAVVGVSFCLLIAVVCGRFRLLRQPQFFNIVDGNFESPGAFRGSVSGSVAESTRPEAVGIFWELEKVARAVRGSKRRELRREP